MMSLYLVGNAARKRPATYGSAYCSTNTYCVEVGTHDMY